MALNGSIGRARELARIRRAREAEARAAGIDPADRSAMRRFEAERWNRMVDDMRATGALSPLAAGSADPCKMKDA